MANDRIKYILGLDLGVASVGWALVPCDYSQISEETLKMGARVFEPGTDGKLDEGKDESRNLKRRTARGVRRNFWRRRRRAVKLFNILQNAGLLPSAACHSPSERQTFFNALDVKLRDRYFPELDRVTAQTFLYKLRAMALDQELDLDAVGRVFYALGQRRGFQSNKKADPEDDGKDKELGKVKGSIAELNEEIAESGSRTLGEYFSKLDPEEAGKRIRERYVGRQAYKDEFEQIWEAQRRFRPEVYTDALKDKVFKGIFYQRPLKSQKNLVSRCDLEPSKRCIAKGDPLFQEFRYWQRVLDMLVFDPSNEGYRALTPEEQDTIVAMLDSAEQVKFDDMREALGFPKKNAKSDNWKFNFELDLDGADKVIIGNKTRARIRKALENTGVRGLPVEEIDRIAKQILFYDNDSALADKLLELYPHFSEETAAALSKVRFEPDYGSLSRKAIENVLPLMKEKRIPYATARKELYGETLQDLAAGKAVDILDPVDKALGPVRNPTVTRALTEMRKVVNAIIRRYGKPEYIRVELARDLKRGRKEREEIFKSNKERERDRKKAEEAIREVMGWGKDSKITRHDVLKYRLWEECGGVCPYTGKTIALRTLFSDETPIDVEHIIPFSISLDDSFTNKTLCYADENRHVKKNQTPYQAYGRTDKWADILARVKKFKTRRGGRNRKLELFEMREIPKDIAVTRLLNDTRYISKLALKYLGTLYAAVNGVDPESKKRVQVVIGDTTAWLRDAWELNVILLSDTDKRIHDATGRVDDIVKKNRDDHRHHAIDAVVIALTDPSMVAYMNKNAAAFYDLKFRGGFLRREFETPVEKFQEILENVVANIIVSRRVNRKVSGALHEETNYGAKVYEDKGAWRTLRKPVSALSAKDVENIVDRRIRMIVSEKLQEVGGDPKKLVDENLPVLRITKGGKTRIVPIKSVRFRKNVKARGIGKRGHERYVASGANHHLEVYAVLDDQGNELRWESEVVDLMEAYRRVREKESVVRRDFGPKTRFKFSFVNGEAFVMNDGNLYVVRVITARQSGVKSLETKLHTDARLTKEIKATKGLAHEANTLKNKGVAKVYIDVLGQVYPAND